MRAGPRDCWKRTWPSWIPTLSTLVEELRNIGARAFDCEARPFRPTPLSLSHRRLRLHPCDIHRRNPAGDVVEIVSRIPDRRVWTLRFVLEFSINAKTKRSRASSREHSNTCRGRVLTCYTERLEIETIDMIGIEKFLFETRKSENVRRKYKVLFFFLQERNGQLTRAIKRIWFY